LVVIKMSGNRYINEVRAILKPSLLKIQSFCDADLNSMLK